MRRHRRAPLGLALLALTVLAGCGQSPASAPQTSFKQPTFVRTAAPPTGTFGATTDGPVTTSAVIDGKVGGVIQLREFRLDIPEGAFEGSATITMTMPDPTIYQVDLHIEPPTANHFVNPVILTATLPTRPDAMADDFLWYDGSQDVWRVIPTDRNVGTVTVSAPLSHFSLYGVVDYLLGKAGW